MIEQRRGAAETIRAAEISLSWHVVQTIDRFLRNASARMEIVGCTSVSALGGLLAHETLRWIQKPHLIVLPDEDDFEKFELALKTFSEDFSVFKLPSFDVSLYSGLQPHRRVSAQRVAWCASAQNAKPGQIFLATPLSLSQKTLPFQILQQNQFLIKKGQELPKGLNKILESYGYQQTPLVEDLGSYSLRGGIIDIYSPANAQPLRIELFGDFVESIRLFDPENQRSSGELDSALILPCLEIVDDEKGRRLATKNLREIFDGVEFLDGELSQTLQQISLGQVFPGIEFLLPYFYSKLASPLEHFCDEALTWVLDPLACSRNFDHFFESLKQEKEQSHAPLLRPKIDEFYENWDEAQKQLHQPQILLTQIRLDDKVEEDDSSVFTPWSVSDLSELSTQAKPHLSHPDQLANFLKSKIQTWTLSEYQVYFSCKTNAQAQRLRLLLERAEHAHLEIIITELRESLLIPSEKFVLLRDEEIFVSRKSAIKKKRTPQADENKEQLISFSDLKPNDLIVHVAHGIGVYEGLKVMQVQGVDAEFIQIKYKDNDRLYLPIYRIGQISKYSGPSNATLLDKLGGSSWEKTKTKVRAHLRDMASELLHLYAQRSVAERPPYNPINENDLSFAAAFAYDETDDQLKAIDAVLADLQEKKPLDRLICGDVGFGKTEVAMRAAFKVAQDRKQVAVVAPTTVLTFQHLETFKKRFRDWPLEIRSLNRFVQPKDVKKTLADLKDGKVDIVIGTHRLLSSDVQFKDLGLMIIDEEQKFGVKHKEKLRKIKHSVDTLAMSATPIPRSLNMSLVGIRDLSLITTAPVDRLPTRTFVCRFEEETIRKAVLSEVQRGGQVYFIHNRVQGIYALEDELKKLLPEVRIAVGHGQMPEDQLEEVMIKFFNHDIDVLLCTTIVESGMDVPRANTMFIDNAHQLGLSQLYQLRGRVGRSQSRAYCYLLVPPLKTLDKDAQERLRVIQENTALGSGLRIAQHDLELRGAGDLLGEDQSGHINAVGYELYLELLEDALHDLQGKKSATLNIEPEINVRIPALIPDAYVPDLRMRLAYYKEFTKIKEPADLDSFEEQMRDQFGPVPEQVINLMGFMLIRHYCCELGIRDVSAGKSSVSLAFVPQTPLSNERILELVGRANKKYSVTPDSRLNIRMNEIAWPRIMDELLYLKSLL